MSDGSGKLGSFLREVSNWSWDNFWLAERDQSFTTNQAVIFALIRACAMQDLNAIRIAMNRLDGKLKTPVRVEYPKIFYLYPNAKPLDTSSSVGLIDESNGAPGVGATSEVVSGEVVIASEPEEAESDLPSLSLRQTLSKMSDYPRNVPEQLVAAALQTEQWMRRKAPKPVTIPAVKAVVAAHLLVMAQNRNIDALTEVFDQIDGKLVETIQLIGDDIYITVYSEVAPPNATLNKDGVLQTEAIQSQDLWAAKLGGEGAHA